MSERSLNDIVQELQDMEAIKKLKYRYAAGCDDAVNKGDAEAFLSVFTPEILWDGGAFGRFEGIDALKEMGRAVTGQIKFTYHFFTNPLIEINDASATGKWYLFAIYTMAGGEDRVLVGVEEDKYEKIDGEWLISEMKLTTEFFAPYREGWGPGIMAR